MMNRSGPIARYGGSCVGIWLSSGRVLDRLMLVMNDKQNRWARQEIYDQLVHSWLVQDGAGTG